MSTTYKIVSGDTFELISKKSYGTGANTGLIMSANPGVSEPLSTGTTINVPDDPNAPQNLKQNAEANSINEVAVLINGERFRYWSEINISDPIDSLQTLSFIAPFVDSIKPFSFQRIELTIGGEYIFTGTIVSVTPRIGPDVKELSVEAYALPGVLNDCTMPSSNFPLEFESLNLKNIADSIIKPFGLVSEFTDDPGAIFEVVSIDADRKILDFLIALAKQRGLIISSTSEGKLLFRKSTESTLPVANLNEGASPLVSITPNFRSQEYYSHITGLEPVFAGLAGSQYTVKNERLTNVIRPLNFLLPDTLDASVKQAVEAKAGRMFGNIARYNLSVATWRDPQGQLWKSNTLINVLAPSVFINTNYKFLIKGVTLLKNANSESAVLELVLPGAFSGKIPEVLPWG